MEKKPFYYTREEIFSGKTRYGTPVYDGTFALLDNDKIVRVKEAAPQGTHFIRKNGKTYKTKGNGDISTSIHWLR